MRLSTLVFTAIAVLVIAVAAQGQTLGFYGGDVNPDDPNVYSFPNGNTLAQPDTHTYGCATVPYGRTFRTAGFIFNVVANVQDPNIFDPMIATYEIHRSIGPGNPGLTLKAGVEPILVTPTGRTPFGETEYTVQLMFGGARKLPFGGAYCINITPQCTNPDNPNCSIVQFFVDNTTSQTNGIHKRAELPQQLWVYSPSLG